MDKRELEKFIELETCTISEAMRKIESNSCGIIFITDINGKLLGCVTDGDIRRFMLSGGDMSSKIDMATNYSPKVARNINDAKSLYHKKNYIVIPIIDENGQILDLYDGTDEESDTKKRAHIDIPVVINAGGRGTRLDPFTKVLPKPLIPVGEIPIMEHIIKEYQAYDCNDFHIIVNYKKELIKAFFSDNDSKYNITWYDEGKPLGTGGGVRLLKDKITSTFFFANCDALLTADYGSILDFHKANGNMITIVSAYKTIDIPYGVIEVGQNGIIKEMKEKPQMSFLTNTGIYVVEPEVINYVGDDENIGFPDIAKRVMDKGNSVAAFPVSENDWMDMGQIPELEKMRKKLYGE